MPVSEAELASLASSHDIIRLGVVADDERRRRHGRRTTFVRVADVSSEPGAPVDVPPAAGECRIVGTPASRAAAVQRVRDVVAAKVGVPLSGFSLSDLEAMALADKVTLRSLLEELCAEGLEIIASAPFDRLRDPRRSIEEVNIAGMRLGRLTIEQLPSVDPVALYRQIGELQYEVAVVHAFAPLPRTINPAVPTTGFEDVKRVALARIMLDSISSIQVDWTLYGAKLAQVALTVGADDLDAVSPVDDLSEGRRRAPLEEVRRNIEAAGLEPVQRDGRFDPARVTAAIRLGAVEYLNARPLVYGLEHSPRFALRFDVPAQCAELLHAGDIDLGLIPSIEYLRGPEQYAIVPSLAVASVGPVASVALYTRKDVTDLKSIALDTTSRTSVALTRVMASRAFGITPELVAMAPDLPSMLAAADAALIIGDKALFLDHAAEGVQKIDLGALWTETTGLPFVYAFWAGRPGVATGGDVRRLRQARDEGLAHIPAVAAAYYPADPASRAVAEQYLRDNIRHSLEGPELEGLKTFYRYASELGLATFAGELRFYHAESD